MQFKDEHSNEKKLSSKLCEELNPFRRLFEANHGSHKNDFMPTGKKKTLKNHVRNCI
jgi:hypothetical protein